MHIYDINGQQQGVLVKTLVELRDIQTALQVVGIITTTFLHLSILSVLDAQHYILVFQLRFTGRIFILHISKYRSRHVIATHM